MSNQAYGHRVTEEQVRQQLCPVATDTFKPLPHHLLLNMLEEATEKAGIVVSNKTYSLARGGDRVFGVWEIENGPDLRGAIGLRNANDKSMAVGLCAGDKVMVCSNMAFNGEWVEFRKHTAGLDFKRLEAMLAAAINKIIDKIGEFKKWHESLHNVELNPVEQRVLTFSAAEKGIISFSDCPEMVKLTLNPNTKVYEPTLHGFHGGVTQVMRDKSLNTMQSKHGKLTRFINDYVNS